MYITTDSRTIQVPNGQRNQEGKIFLCTMYKQHRECELGPQQIRKPSVHRVLLFSADTLSDLLRGS